MNNSTTTTASYVCLINSKTSTIYDEGQCIIANIAATLYKYDFGYFCIGILGLIAFISIFGGIKQNYRWFILNQVIWDILKSCEFSCENYLSSFVKPSPKCFYYAGDGKILIQWDYTFRQIIMNNIYTPWVLISVTRVIALYHVNFYAKLTQGYRIIVTIIVFNALFMIFDTEQLITKWNIGRNNWLISECKNKQPTNSTIDLCSLANLEDSISDLVTTIFKILVFIRVFKPSICLMISSVATTMIIFKVAKQAKFQLKHNRRDFFGSARIAAVITSQTATNFLIFCIQFSGTFTTFMGIFSTIRVKTARYTPTSTNYIDFTLPLWIDGPFGLTGYGGQQFITQSRILIESIIVLCIMTGYREAIVKIFQKTYLFFRSPRKFYKSLKKSSPSNSWT